MKIPRRHGMSAFLFPFLLAACGGCSDTWVVPVVPPDNPPMPTPPPRPDPAPTPVPPSSVVPWATTERIGFGMTEDALIALMGPSPQPSRAMGDGTFLTRWQTVNAAGEPKFVDVEIEGGKVTGTALVPRAVPPEPVASIRNLRPLVSKPHGALEGTLPSGEIDLCPNGVCGVPK